MAEYRFDMFEKAGVAPRADAIIYGIENESLPFSVASDFEQWMMENRGVEGSPEVFAADSKAEALTALDLAGYKNSGSGRDVLRYAALASLGSAGGELLSDIERVYADFDYPEDMNPFIYYMPSVDCDPSPEKLIARFHAFMAEEKARLKL